MAGSLRKYLLSRRVLAASLGVLPLLRLTRRQPLGLRIGVAWLAWAGAVALAVQTVRERSAERRDRHTP